LQTISKTNYFSCHIHGFEILVHFQMYSMISSSNVEYHSVCPLVGIGTLPPPLSPASVPLPPEPKRGSHSSAGEGLGESHFRRLGEKLSTRPTLWDSTCKTSADLYSFQAFFKNCSDFRLSSWVQTKREIFEQIGLDLDERFMEAVMETEVKPRGLLPPLGDSWDVSVRKFFFSFYFSFSCW
jgi:hypothetical protein